MTISIKFVSLRRVFSPLLCLTIVAQVIFLIVVNQVQPSDNHDEIGAIKQKRDGNSRYSQVQVPRSAKNASLTSGRRSRFAYAFLIAGCDPKKDSSYRGFLYNVLVSRTMLQLEGSKADVVLLIRMKNRRRPRLPLEEERWLRESGIRLLYLPRPALGESFYSAMMAKFTILNLTEYSRVMYLDADVMPLCNLDYVFELSEQGVLKENLVVTWWAEPALGAIFMLRPGVGEYHRLEEIVALQQSKARNKWPPFDEVEGWGHKIDSHDAWYAFKRPRDTRWNFQFAFADQGLLYHWVKYEKKSVSILLPRQVLNYAKSINGTVMLEQALSSPFQNVTCPRFPWDISAKKGGQLNGAPLYHDFKHFTGLSKPWEKDNIEAGGIPEDVGERSNATTALQLWFHVLRRVKRQLNMSSLDVEHLSLGRPALGRFPILSHMLPPKT